MRRLFARELPLAGGLVRLDPAAARHARVLRLSPGDEVLLFDGRGAIAEARIERLEDDRGEALALASQLEPSEDPRVVLVQAIAKGEKLDSIVRMATELGALAIHLAVAERSVTRPDEERAARKIDRLERIAREAARQSGRARVPTLVPAAPLLDVGERPPQESLRLLFVPGASRSIDEACRGGAEAWIAIGPEGGFSATEIASLSERGWIGVGLGDGVLRVETAAPVALALAMHALGGMRPR